MGTAGPKRGRDGVAARRAGMARAGAQEGSRGLWGASVGGVYEVSGERVKLADPLAQVTVVLSRAHYFLKTPV